MPQAIITLAYKQIIDANYKNAFEQQVWNASYNEYLLKSQAYNTSGEYKTFTALKAHDGRANSLHYKSGFAAHGFIEMLNKKIPQLVTNLFEPVHFVNYEFSVIESHMADKQQHSVAITYYTRRLHLHDVIGNYLLLSVHETERNSGEKTFMLPLQPLLSVNSYEALVVV